MLEVNHSHLFLKGRSSGAVWTAFYQSVNISYFRLNPISSDINVLADIRLISILDQDNTSLRYTVDPLACMLSLGKTHRPVWQQSGPASVISQEHQPEGVINI